MNEWKLERLQEMFDFGEKVFYPDMSKGFPVISLDEKFATLFGYTPSELMMQCRNRGDELVSAEEIKEYAIRVVEGLERNQKYTCSYSIRRRDGECIWLKESGVLVSDEEKSYVKAIVVNITREKSIQKELNTVYENLPGGVFTMLVTDSTFYIVESNERSLEMLGTTREEYLGSSGMYTFSEDLPGLRACVVQAAANKQPIDYEFRSFAGRKKEFHWFRIYCGYYKDTDDGVEYIGILSDVTEQKNMLFQLETEKERYRLAVELSSSLFFEYSLETKQMRIYIQSEKSEYIYHTMKFSTGEIGDLIRIGHFVHEDDCEGLENLFLSNTNGNIKVRLLVEKRQTGEKVYLWHEIDMRKIYEDKKTTRIVGSARNIQEQQEREMVNKDLRQIYESQIEKVFEMFLRVRIPDGHMKLYLFGDMEMQQEFYTEYFDDFILAFCDHYVHPDDREQFFDAMQLVHMKEILDISKMEESLFFRVRRKDSAYRYKCFRYSYLNAGQREIVISTQDVQNVREEQIRKEEANYRVLMESLDDVQNVMEMRRSFLAMIGRELYSPLNYVQSVLQRANGKDNERIQGALLYMANVIQNVSEYEKLEQGKVRVENLKFVLDQILGRSAKVWRSWAQKENVIFKYNINLNNRYYYGDEKKIIKILDHVIGNSIMTSENGGKVEVWVTDQIQNVGINRISLTIEDTGIPVSNDFFGRSYPSEARNNEKYWLYPSEHGGTAFSLIVARELVQLLGGNIILSRKGESLNIIKIELPLQMEEGENMNVRLKEEISEESNVLRGFSVLVIRNKEVNHSIPAARLQVSGAHVDLASGGMDAIQIIRCYPEGELNAILVEANLGDMDYLEFTELLRQWEKGANPIPVIAIVDEVSPEMVQIGMKIGVNAWLNDLNDLERLATLLRALKM